MALQMQVSRCTSSISSPPRASQWATKNSMACLLGRENRREKSAVLDAKKKKGVSLMVRSSLETAGAVVGQVTEVSKDTFWPIVEAAAGKTVVLDMYTQWCGPCKVMAPKFKELSEKYLDIVFLKLDCNQGNKPLAKELGMKVVPTFKILKDRIIVKEVKGAKFDDLVVAIENARSSQ